MLTVTKKTTKQVPVEVVRFRWVGSVKGPLAQKLPCTVCRKPIGRNRFGVAWLKQNGGKEYSARLCEQCGEKAEIEQSNNRKGE